MHFIVLASAFILVGHINFLPDWTYAHGVQVSLMDRPFDILFSSEKVILLPLIIFGISKLYEINLETRAWRAGRISFIATLAGALILIGPALALHYVRFEPKLPSIGFIWGIHNLAFVCVIEELLFRNYLFEGLGRWFKKNGYPIVYTTLISSILFGLNHFRSGAALVLLATIAGAVYAWAYKKSGIVAAILSHFGVNLIHFLLFSYPSIQRGLH